MHFKKRSVCVLNGVECCTFHYIIIKDSATLIQPAVYSIRYKSFCYNRRKVLYRIMEEEFKQETE